MLGEPLGAEEALGSGLRPKCARPPTFPPRAQRWAQRLAAQPPLAVKGTKIAVNAQLKQALLTSFDLSTALEIARSSPPTMSRRSTPSSEAAHHDSKDDDGARGDPVSGVDAIEAIMTTRAIRRFTDDR